MRVHHTCKEEVASAHVEEMDTERDTPPKSFALRKLTKCHARGKDARYQEETQAPEDVDCAKYEGNYSALRTHVVWTRPRPMM